MSVRLGRCGDGRALHYDSAAYRFYLGDRRVSYDEIAALDRRGEVAWLAGEQRDWFNRIDRADLDACAAAACDRALAADALDPYEQVRRDARRDDSVLEGRLVDVDDALVRAVIDRLEIEGALARGSDSAETTESPLAAAVLPEGMEPLGQVVKREGRSATALERVLARCIMRNDDKAKARRERRERKASDGVGDAGVAAKDGSGDEMSET